MFLYSSLLAFEKKHFQISMLQTFDFRQYYILVKVRVLHVKLSPCYSLSTETNKVNKKLLFQEMKILCLFVVFLITV